MTSLSIKDFDAAMNLGATSKAGVSKLVQAWEAKNNERTKRAVGLGLMAVSLAACGGSDDSDDGDDGTDPTPVAQTFELSARANEVVGGDGDDYIDGTTAGTLNDNDDIDGGDGDDTLDVTIDNDQPAPVIANVENIIVQSTHANADLDLTNSDNSIETIRVTSSSTALDILAAQNSFDLAVDNGTGNVSVTFVDDALGNAEASFSISVDNVTNTIAITSGGDDLITSITIDASGGDSVVTLDVTADDGGDDDLTTVTVTGDAAIDLRESGAEFSVVTEFDFSANSGGVTINLDTNDADFALTGSSGDDSVTVGSDGVDGRSVDLGAGDDTIVFGAGDINADDVIDGGAGDNTVEIDVDDADEINDRFTNFTAVTLTGASAANAALDLTDTGITTVTLANGIDLHTGSDELSIDNYDGALTIVVADNNLGGANADLTISSVGSSDAVTISFAAGAATTISDIDLTFIETVNLSTDSALDDVTMTAATVLDGVQTLTVSGAGNMAITSTTVNALTTVDASDMSGDFDFSVTDADINALTITLGDFATGSSITLDAGEDEADTIILTDVISANTTLAIAEFSADATDEGDQIDLSAFGLDSSDLTITDGGANTTVAFTTSDTFTVTITLTGVTGVAANDIILNNIEL